MDSRALEVLEANEAFYRAFAERDANGMERIWAVRHPVACIHPGWDVLDGRAEVVASWRRILESGSAPEISVSLAEARLLGDVAFVTCHERFADAVLAATNVFLREDGAWKMVHHQATPIAPGQERPAPATGRAN
jgi:ketosteroid isomerase-like protein